VRGLGAAAGFGVVLDPDIVLGAVVVVVCAVAARVDLQRRVIPNRLTAAGAVAAVAAGAALDPAGELARMGWGAGAGGVLLAAALANPAGMGIGDAKLVAVIGLCLGPAVLVAVLVAFGLGALYGLCVLVRHGLRAARAATMAFAPCLAAGALTGTVLVAL
jgi:leader peptidase (prepilin peptidase)/N-methyltransferase